MITGEAIRAQLDPPMVQVLRPFDRIRRQRHDVEYPPTDAPQITAEDVRDDAAKAAAMVDLSERILDQMSPFWSSPSRGHPQHDQDHGRTAVGGCQNKSPGPAGHASRLAIEWTADL